MSLFHSQSSLTLFVCWIPLPVKEGLWEGPPEEARGVHRQPGGRPLFTRLAESSIFPSTIQMEAPEAEFSPWTMLSTLNTVNRLARQGNCGHFFLSRAGFSLMVCIKARQCGLISHLQSLFKNGPTNKAWLYIHVLRANRRFVQLTKKYILKTGLFINWQNKWSVGRGGGVDSPSAAMLRKWCQSRFWILSEELFGALTAQFGKELGGRGWAPEMRSLEWEEATGLKVLPSGQGRKSGMSALVRLPVLGPGLPPSLWDRGLVGLCRDELLEITFTYTRTCVQTRVLNNMPIILSHWDQVFKVFWILSLLVLYLFIFCVLVCILNPATCPMASGLQGPARTALSETSRIYMKERVWPLFPPEPLTGWPEGSGYSSALQPLQHSSGWPWTPATLCVACLVLTLLSPTTGPSSTGNPFPSICLRNSCLFLDFSSKVLFSCRTSLTSCLGQIPFHALPWTLSHFWFYVDLWAYCLEATSHRHPVELYKTRSQVWGWESHPDPSPCTIPGPKLLLSLCAMNTWVTVKSDLCLQFISAG